MSTDIVCFPARFMSVAQRSGHDAGRREGVEGAQMTAGGWIGLIFALAGGGLVSLGAAIGLHSRRLAREGRQVPATIVDIVTIRAIRHSQPMRSAVFEFVGDDGTRVRKQSSVSSINPAHGIGDAVMVVYDPAHPERADIAGEGRLVAPFLIALGLVFVVAGIAIIAATRA